MIKEMWSLVYQSKIVGVRIKTNTGRYFDLDMDTLKRIGYRPSGLRPLELIEFGDLLMTLEEFDSDLLIEDGSGNEKLMLAVQQYFRERDKNDPAYQARRNTEINKLVSQYYSFIDLAWRREFAEYHLDHFEGNKGIYEHFNEEQRKVIRDYFRWHSRIIFNQHQARRVLRKSPKKAKELAYLMGNAEDWEYDGTVDTGEMGGGQCEMGHALRYEHYAHSPSLDKTIVFGSTCISDFFQVDKSVIDLIQRSQETLMKEVKVMAFIKATGKVKKHHESLNDFWAVMSKHKGAFDKITPNGAGWAYFIAAFYKQGLPLTKAMMDVFKKWRWTKSQAEIEKEKREGRIQASDNDPMVEIERKFQRIEKAAEAGLIPKTLFAFKIIPTVRRMKRMTPRQEHFIIQALEQIPTDFNPEESQGNSGDNYTEAPTNTINTASTAPVQDRPFSRSRVQPATERKSESNMSNTSADFTGDDGIDYSDIF